MLSKALSQSLSCFVWINIRSRETAGILSISTKQVNRCEVKLNRNGHIAIGLIVFAIYVWILLQVRPIDTDILAISGTTSVLGSVLPDFIEPSTDFRHRGFAHSKEILKKSASILPLISLAVVVLPLFLTIFSALLGYTLHLVADSTSTVGIPD